MQVIGTYKTPLAQACLQMLKIKILIKPGLDREHWESEEPYKHRFFITMIDEHIKIVDVKLGKLFDFSAEKEYD